MLDVCFSRCVFINGGENGSWGLSWLVELEEGMRVVLCFLTGRAVVKVLAYSTFVSWTDDWSLATAVAFNIWMLDRLWIDGGSSV